MSNRRACVYLLLIATIFCSLSFAVTPDRISGSLTAGQTVTLSGNVHRKALPQYDQGPVDPAFQLTYMTLLTTSTPSQIKALQDLLAQQQDRKSVNYHKWLTPEQWADRFGLSNNDVRKLTTWLKSQGFTILSVAHGRNWIVFAGTAAQVQNTFGAEIHHYKVDGEAHFANSTAPRVPAALSGIVTGITGLNNFRLKPMNVKSTRAALAKYYDNIFSTPDFIAPGDIATIYDINALITAGFDGTGQTLAVAGQTDVYLADLNDFRTGFNLPTISCTADSNGQVTTSCNTSNFQYILNGPDPGVSLGDLTEADLDLEWSAAVARGAKIIYINSGGTANGVFDAWHYAIDNNVAPVISLSYGNCEFNDNFVLSSTGVPLADELELMKANSQGITFLNSSGDSGAAECDPSQDAATGNLAIGGIAVSYPASSPEVTGVGGTAITYPGGFASNFWSTTNGANGGSAQNPPLPETSWNDDEELALAFGQFNAEGWQQNYAIVQTGGGASNCAEQTANNLSCQAGFPQPSWQTVTVPGQASVRFSPDVSLLGSPNFPGYIFCVASDAWIGGSSTASTCAGGIPAALALTDSNGNPAPSVVGGTSASTPVFAGIVTILNQYLSASGGLGNINPMLYTLAKNSPSAFHQVTTGDNDVYCEVGTPTSMPTALQCPAAGVLGFSASNADSTTGYNLVTGLGSVDANNLATAWLAALPGFSMSAGAANPTSVSAGNSATTTVTITPQNGFSGTVNFSCSGTTGVSCSFNPTTVSGSGSTQATIQTTADMATGATTVTVKGTSGAVSSSTSVNLTVMATTQSYTLTPANTSYQVAQGSNATVNVTLTPTNGFNLPVTYTCTDSVSESTCTGPNGPTTSTAVSFTVTTTAPTAKLQRPLSRAAGIFYAALLPGLLGIMFTVGSRKRSLRGMRLLGLIVALGLSTLWMASCGGGSSTPPPNQGTPVGTYTITISGKTSGAMPITPSNAPVTFQLVVVQ